MTSTSWDLTATSQESRWTSSAIQRIPPPLAHKQLEPRWATRQLRIRARSTSGQSQGRPTTNRGLAAHSVIRRPARPACSLKPLVPERAPTLTASPDTEAAPPPQSHVTTTPRGHTAHSEADPRSAAFTTSVGRTARSCAGRALRACRARARWRAQSRGAQRPTAGADAPGSTPASAGSDEPASDATAPSPRAAGLAGPMTADDPKLSSGKLTAAPALTVGRGDRQRDRCRRVHVGWVVDGNSSHPCARETFLQEEDDANGFATSRE